jgi:hypothetical protein
MSAVLIADTLRAANRAVFEILTDDSVHGVDICA